MSNAVMRECGLSCEEVVWLDVVQKAKAWKANFWLLCVSSDLASFFFVSFIQRLHGFAGIFVYFSIGGTCYRPPIFVLANKFCQ